MHCTPETFNFYINRIDSMALSLESLLARRRANKTLTSHVTNSNVTASDNLNTSLNNTQASTRTRNRRKRKPRNTHTTIRLDTTSVINLSQTPLSNDESSVLARGLTFCPTPRRINWSEVSADINDFTRRMRLTEYFHDHNNASNTNPTNPFHNKSSWTPPTNRDSALNAYIDAIKHDISTSNLNHITDNLTTRERESLRNLKKRPDIVIKPADKGSGTVVMDKTWYVNECNRQLNDVKFYRKQDEDITNQIQQRVIIYVQHMLKDGYIDEKTKQYLIQTDVKPGRFYILPKIHKTGNPGRPIVSSHSSLTTTLTLSSLPWIHTLKTLLTFLTNSLTLVLYLVTPCLSLSTFHHCTPTSHTTKELMPAVISLVLVLTNTFLLRHFATFYA